MAPGELFPGQYFDSETGLHYNYFRDYDPKTGRYIEADPIGQLSGTNLYSYSINNPIGWIDPYGLAGKCAAWECGVYGGTIPENRNAPSMMQKPKPPSREEVAKFFNELSRQSGAAAGMCAIGAQPEGILVFGTISAGSSIIEHAIRPDLPSAVVDSSIDIVTDGLPPNIGVPINILYKESNRIKQRNGP